LLPSYLELRQLDKKVAALLADEGATYRGKDVLYRDILAEFVFVVNQNTRTNILGPLRRPVQH
jgi:hypothetical protein